MGTRRTSIFRHARTSSVKSGGAREAAPRSLPEWCSTTRVDCFSFCMRGYKVELEDWDLPAFLLTLLFLYLGSHTTRRSRIGEVDVAVVGKTTPHVDSVISLTPHLLASPQFPHAQSIANDAE